MNREDDELVRSQSDAAAAEAGAIGGDPGLVEEDPAQAPVIEAGGGVAEGFEQAEGALVDNAVNPDNPGHPRHHAFTPSRSQTAQEPLTVKPTRLRPPSTRATVRTLRLTGATPGQAVR